MNSLDINQINTVEGASAPIYSQVFDDVIFQDLTERATTNAGDVNGFRKDAQMRWMPRFGADLETQSEARALVSAFLAEPA